MNLCMLISSCKIGCVHRYGLETTLSLSLSLYYQVFYGIQEPKAFDVVAVRRFDETTELGPFHVRFNAGKSGTANRRIVRIKVNNKDVNISMKVGAAGEAFFIERTREKVLKTHRTSPITSRVTSPATVPTNVPDSFIPHFELPSNVESMRKSCQENDNDKMLASHEYPGNSDMDEPILQRERSYSVDAILPQSDSSAIRYSTAEIITQDNHDSDRYAGYNAYANDGSSADDMRRPRSLSDMTASTSAHLDKIHQSGGIHETLADHSLKNHDCHDLKYHAYVPDQSLANTVTPDRPQSSWTWSWGEIPVKAKAKSSVDLFSQGFAAGSQRKESMERHSKLFQMSNKSALSATEANNLESGQEYFLFPQNGMISKSRSHGGISNLLPTSQADVMTDLDVKLLTRSPIMNRGDTIESDDKFRRNSLVPIGDPKNIISNEEIILPKPLPSNLFDASTIPTDNIDETQGFLNDCFSEDVGIDIESYSLLAQYPTSQQQEMQDTNQSLAPTNELINANHASETSDDKDTKASEVRNMMKDSDTVLSLPMKDPKPALSDNDTIANGKSISFVQHEYNPSAFLDEYEYGKGHDETVTDGDIISLQDIPFEDILPGPAGGDLYESDTDSYHSLSHDESEKDNNGFVRPKRYRYRKVLIPSKEQKQNLGGELVAGRNEIVYETDGCSPIKSELFLWSEDSKIVVIDVDGAITLNRKENIFTTLLVGSKSTVHDGVTTFLENIAANGYHILYIAQNPALTKGQLEKIVLDVTKGRKLPPGPVIHSPQYLITGTANTSRTDSFIQTVLRGLKVLFPVHASPYFACFVTNDKDMEAVSRCGVPEGRIFTVDRLTGDIRSMNRTMKRSFDDLNKFVDETFPPYAGKLID